MKLNQGFPKEFSIALNKTLDCNLTIDNNKILLPQVRDGELLGLGL